MRLPPVLSSVGSRELLRYGFNVNAREVAEHKKNDEQTELGNGLAVPQSRIHAMSLRLFALVALVLFGAVAVVGCGLRDEGGGVSENVSDSGVGGAAGFAGDC